ncbi:MAG TPA: hypothetical protein VFF32_04155 [Dermatophilaceae bacterium]|nr:hypothetical protein [Dermatophilaceae bacterium]
MMRPRMPRRMPLAVLLVTLALPVGGAANAFWSASGSGAGSGAAGTTVAVTLSAGTPAATLYPAGAANVLLTASNPNASPVRIGSLALDTSQGAGTGFAVDAGHSGCAVSTLSFTTATNGGAGWTVPGKVGAVDGTLPITLTNALAMGVGAADACQGASFTVYLAAGP